MMLCEDDFMAVAEACTDCKDDEFIAFWEDLTSDFEHIDTKDEIKCEPIDQIKPPTPPEGLFIKCIIIVLSLEIYSFDLFHPTLEMMGFSLRHHFDEGMLDSLARMPVVTAKVVSKKLDVVKSAIKPLSNYFAKKVMAGIKLCPFPTFDKSDAMLYLPSTLAKHANSGDMDKFASVLKLHSDKNASVILCSGSNLTLPIAKVLELAELVDDFFPDSMNCMHSTKVVGNTIQAVMYYKYTDSPEVYKHADYVVSDPLFRSFFAGGRKQCLERNLQLETKSESVQQQIAELIDLQEELQIYGKSDLTMTFDPFTKKILTYRMSWLPCR